VTAVCVMLFSLLHYPCSTTLLTIFKESGSKKWTLLAFALPTIIAILACGLVAQTAHLLAG
jgi:ferrous iron transport protein B